MASWSKRYDAARKEMSAAEEEYRIADRARARANARLNNAERDLNAIFHERMKEIEDRVSVQENADAK